MKRWIAGKDASGEYHVIEIELQEGCVQRNPAHYFIGATDPLLTRPAREILDQYGFFGLLFGNRLLEEQLKHCYETKDEAKSALLEWLTKSHKAYVSFAESAAQDIETVTAL